MATPISILSCSQHATYHICTHTHTHSSSEHTAFPAPAVSASLAPVSFSECLTGSQALAFSSASLSRGSDSLSFSLEPIQRLKWLPFSQGIEPFFSLYPPCISSLPLSINQSVSLPLSVTTFLLAPFFISWVLPRHTKAPVDAESPGSCMHSSRACDTIAGYSSAHFTLISAAQYRQSVPLNLRCFFCCCGELAGAGFSSEINRVFFLVFFSGYKENYKLYFVIFVVKFVNRWCLLIIIAETYWYCKIINLFLFYYFICEKSIFWIKVLMSGMMIFDR